MYARANSQYRKYAVPILLLLLLQSLVGCAPATTGQPPAQMPTTAPTEIPVATSTPVPPPTPTPVPTETPFVPKATIKVVLHMPLSGPQPDVGLDLQRAAEMAIRELSGPLNELGYQVDAVSYDDRMDNKTAVTNAREIVADPEVRCGVGHYTSGVMIQASEIYHTAGLAFISPSNTNTTVTDRGYLEVNRVVGRLDVQGIAGAQFAKSQGFSAVYLIQSSSDPLKKNGEYFKREADRLGVKVVGIVTTNVSDDFSDIVSRMMNLKPDLVYFAGTAAQAGLFFRQARPAGYTGAFLGIDSDPGLASLAGPQLGEGGGAYYVDVVAPASAYEGAAQFLSEFQSLYGAAPRLFAAQAYDAAGICLKGIEEASKAVGGELPTRAEVAQAIRGLVDYQGITGTYNFNKRGDPTVAQYFVFKVTGVDAADWAHNVLVATLEVSPP